METCIRAARIGRDQAVHAKATCLWNLIVPAATEKGKRGRPDWPSPFSRRVDETRRKKLEAEAQTKLHLPRRIPLRVEYPPTAWIRNILSRVGKHQVVENVQEEELDLGGETLRDSNVLLHAEIHVPVGQSANCSLSGAIATSIHAQNRGAELGEGGNGIFKHIEARTRCTILLRNGVAK